MIARTVACPEDARVMTSGATGRGGPLISTADWARASSAPVINKIAMERRVGSVIPVCVGAYVVTRADLPRLFGTPRRTMSDAAKKMATVRSAAR